MISKQERQMLREVRNEVLNSSDPYKIIYRKKEGHEESLFSTMTDIAEMIEHDFDLDQNPLSHLRRYFPGYEWKLINPKRPTILLTYISLCDYAWLMSSSWDWSMGVVIADKCGTMPKGFCLCPNPIIGGVVQEESNRGAWPSELREIGARY